PLPRPPPISTLFPYTTLFRSNGDAIAAQWGDLPFFTSAVGSTFSPGLVFAWTYGKAPENYFGGWALSIFDQAGNGVGGRGAEGSDRKSTRLNSSHVSISYAVF